MNGALYALSRWVCLPFFKLFFPTTILGRENLVDGKAVVVCNHYSLSDTMIIFTRVFKKNLHVLAKKEAFDQAKIVGWYLRQMGAIPIDRSIVDLEAHHAVFGALKDGDKVLIYPEGTRNREGDPFVMGEIKFGAEMFAIKSDAPIIPLTYYNRHRMFRRNYLIIGKPIRFDGEAQLSPKEQRSRCRERLTEAFKELRAQVNEYVDTHS